MAVASDLAALDFDVVGTDIADRRGVVGPGMLGRVELSARPGWPALRGPGRGTG